MGPKTTGVALLLAIALTTPAMAGTPHSPRQAEAASTLAANQAVVEGLYQAFAQGDGAAIAAALSPDLVWTEAENGPYADRNPYNGPGAVFEGVFGRIGAAFTGFAATPQTYLPNGDRVVVLGRYTGMNNATSEALDAQFVHVFTLADGRIVAFQQYTDTQQWNDVMTPD